MPHQCLVLHIFATMSPNDTPMKPQWHSNEHPCIQIILYYICINDIINEFFVTKYQQSMNYITLLLIFPTKNLIDFVPFRSQMIKIKNRYQSDLHQLFYVKKIDNFSDKCNKTKFEIIFHFNNRTILWHGCYFETQEQIIY